MPDGSLTNCPDNCSGQVLGKLTHRGVVFNPHYYDTLYEVAMREMHSARCRNCIAYRICKGGCPAKALTGGEFREYECEARIKMWRYTLEQIASGISAYGWKTVPSEHDPNVLKMVEDHD